MDAIGQQEASMSRSKQYWFPARRNGVGWGMPQTWQGFVSLLVYLLSIPVFLCLPNYFGHTEWFHWELHWPRFSSCWSAGGKASHYLDCVSFYSQYTFVRSDMIGVQKSWVPGVQHRDPLERKDRQRRYFLKEGLNNPSNL
ncbi:hypothetical protein LL924_00060 [Xanthomonas oryzae]|nr:hypothetical protein LL924_00060 [Xanthomonas oryzae]